MQVGQKGSQERNTSIVATHSSGAKPEKKLKMNFAQIGQSFGGSTRFEPNLWIRTVASVSERPVDTLHQM